MISHWIIKNCYALKYKIGRNSILEFQKRLFVGCIQKPRSYENSHYLFPKTPLFSTKTPVGIQNPRFLKNTKTPVLHDQNPR